MSSSDQTREGILFVVSAPSGAGKTSLCRELIQAVPGLKQSISFATREIRAGERDGVDYHFIDIDTFRTMVSRQEFAEWAEVHGNFYGTALKTIEDAAAAGIDLLLDIDCQGAAQLRNNYQRGVFIFILPPDYSELEKRLRERGTDGDAVILKRLRNARVEIAQADRYDYLVVNDDFETAKQALLAIIAAERQKTSRCLHVLEKFNL